MDKELKSLMVKIEDLYTLDTLMDITNMMKDIVVNDENMSVDTKKKLIFLYLQYRDQHAKLVAQKAGIKGYSSFMAKLKNLFNK